MVEAAIKGEMGSCWGTYDERFEACTDVCQLRERCKHATATAAVRPVEPESISTEEIDSEMDPLEFFITALKGRFTVESGGNDRMTAYRFSKDGEKKGLVKVLNDGQMEIETPLVKIRLQNGIQSAQHANGVFQAIYLA